MSKKRKSAKDLLKERIKGTRRPHDYLIDDAINKESEAKDTDHSEYRDKLVDKSGDESKDRDIDNVVPKSFDGDKSNDGAKDGDGFVPIDRDKLVDKSGDESRDRDTDNVVSKSFNGDESNDGAKDRDDFVPIDGDKSVDKFGDGDIDNAVSKTDDGAKDGDDFVPIDRDELGDKSGDQSGDRDTDETVSRSFAGNESNDRFKDGDNFPNKSRGNLQDDFVDPVILDEMKKRLRQSTSYKKRRTHEETYKKLSVRVYKHLYDLFYEEAAARGGRGTVQELANEILTFWYRNKHKL